MYESTLAFQQSELDYRTDRLRTAAGSKRHHRFPRLRRGAVSTHSTR
jgi:hypothetical protein